MITREQYLDRQSTHAEYYREIYTECNVSFENSPMLPKIQNALANGDEHLNSIPLKYWDALARHFYGGHVRKVFESRGDFVTLAGLVCMLKQAAIDAARKTTR